MKPELPNTVAKPVSGWGVLGVLTTVAAGIVFLCWALYSLGTKAWEDFQGEKEAPKPKVEMVRIADADLMNENRQLTEKADFAVKAMEEQYKETVKVWEEVKIARTSEAQAIIKYAELLMKVVNIGLCPKCVTPGIVGEIGKQTCTNCAFTVEGSFEEMTKGR